MPALGECVTEGTVTRWLKNVGETVEVDEPLLEVSTDKVDTEIPSPFAGTLSRDPGGRGRDRRRRRRAGPDRRPAAPLPQPARPPAPRRSRRPRRPAPRHRHRPSARPGCPRPRRLRQAARRTGSSTRTRHRARAPRPGSWPSPAAGGYVTPLVRKLAAEHGVDLSTVVGTGVGGRIRSEDVLEAAAQAERARAEAAAQAESATRAPAAAPAAAKALQSVSPLRGTTEKASRLRQIIASRMHESLHTMAQLTTVVEVDVTKVARLRARAKADFAAREGVNLTFLPFFVLAATEALKAHPKVNGVLEGDQITYHGEENVGIAVDTERGLVVPVIRGAGDLNLAGIARKIADLAGRTRANKVTPDELSGATFTVTNTGSGGALFDTPIVPVGTSAILGTGAIVKKPVVATDELGAEYIAIRSMCYLALSYDHRLVDGADASRYLQAIKQRIEECDFAAELGS